MGSGAPHCHSNIAVWARVIWTNGRSGLPGIWGIYSGPRCPHSWSDAGDELKTQKQKIGRRLRWCIMSPASKFNKRRTQMHILESVNSPLPCNLIIQIGIHIHLNIYNWLQFPNLDSDLSRILLLVKTSCKANDYCKPITVNSKLYELLLQIIQYTYVTVTSTNVHGITWFTKPVLTDVLKRNDYNLNLNLHCTLGSWDQMIQMVGFSF